MIRISRKSTVVASAAATRMSIDCPAPNTLIAPDPGSA
jgi:hypothetical protein